MLGVDCCSVSRVVLRCGACRSYSESVVPLIQIIVIFGSLYNTVDSVISTGLYCLYLAIETVCLSCIEILG